VPLAGAHLGPKRAEFAKSSGETREIRERNANRDANRDASAGRIEKRERTVASGSPVGQVIGPSAA